MTSKKTTLYIPEWRDNPVLARRLGPNRGVLDWREDARRDDACLDLLTRDFMPCDSAHEMRLARWLARRRRWFRKPLTASEWNGRVPDFELLDVGADPVPLEVYGLADPAYLAAKAEKTAMYRRSGRLFWHWNAGGDAPQSLQEAVKTLPPPDA